MVDIKFKSERDIFQDQEEEENNRLIITQDIEEEKVNQVVKVLRRESFEELKTRNADTFKKENSDIDFAKPGSSKFYIGTKDKVKGEIQFLESEQKQKFVLARITKKANEHTGTNELTYYYFNDPLGARDRAFIWDTIEGDFFLYQFITKEKTYKLFSTERLEIGEYTIWGTSLEMLDQVDMGNTSRIGTKQPLLFAHTSFLEGNQIQSHAEFIERFKKYNLTEKKFIDWLYTNKKGWLHEYPKDFCYIQIANFLACGDDFDTFHLPVLMISETGSGKTTATELIYNKMDEIEEYTDMTSGTLKGLIPSFRSPTELKAGLFLSAKDYAPVDEFFQGISNIHPEEKEKIMEGVKNILDYKIRKHRSGNGSIKGVMRADHIALTNPKSYGRAILQLSNHFKPENLARYFIWYIPNAQIEFTEKKKDAGLTRGDYSYMAQEDFLAGKRYLQSFNCEFDNKKVREVSDIGKNFLSSLGEEYQNVRAFYNSRYYEHCCRLLDALIKIRCWTSGDESFKANDNDYILLKELWIKMLENWSMNFSIVGHERIN